MQSSAESSHTLNGAKSLAAGDHLTHKWKRFYNVRLMVQGDTAFRLER